MQLSLSQGPECPRCGCQDTELLASGQRWGLETETYRCLYCGREWTVAVEQEEGPYTVPYARTKCPGCGSPRTHVQRTISPKPDGPTTATIRYHKCRDCGRNFKSLESSYDRDARRDQLPLDSLGPSPAGGAAGEPGA